MQDFHCFNALQHIPSAFLVPSTRKAGLLGTEFSFSPARFLRYGNEH